MKKDFLQNKCKKVYYSMKNILENRITSLRLLKIIVIIVMLLCPLVLCTTSAQTNIIHDDTLKLYYRHLYFNHMSPYFDWEGHYPITEDLAKSVNHYCFVYYKDTLRRITEVGTDFSWLIHPLMLIGAERVDYFYSPEKITRKYLNAAGEPFPNYKGIYIEEVTFDETGQAKSLKYFDYKGQPMQGKWGISEYIWEKKDTLIIEKRKNKYGAFVNVAPSFPFRTSGLKIDTINHSITHFNLDDNLKVVNSAEGIACYIDKENSIGDVDAWLYYKSNGEVAFHSDYNYAKTIYDNDGFIKEHKYYVGNELVGQNKFDYDKAGNIKSYSVMWNNQPQSVSTNTDIFSFSIKNQIQNPIINSSEHTIDVYIPLGSDLSYIVPTISVSERSTVQPASGIPVDMSIGSYSYIVIAENTVYMQNWTINVHEVNPTNVDAANNDEIKIFPNPCNDKLFILSQHLQKIKNVDILNIQGKQVYLAAPIDNSNASVSVKDLPHGIYLLKIQDYNTHQQIRTFIKK
jgi:hypothetical protein